MLVDPIHEQADVFRGGDLDGGLVAVIICPEVFVFWGGAHNGAGGGGAFVAHRTVDEVDLVEEVDDIDADPVVDIIAVGDFDSLSQVSGVERGLQDFVCELVYFVTWVGGLYLAARLESLVAVKD